MASDEQDERLVALEAWEQSVTAYAAEALRHVTAGLAACITGLPAPRPVGGDGFSRLLDLRRREEEALGRVRDLLAPTPLTRASAGPRHGRASGAKATVSTPDQMADASIRV